MSHILTKSSYLIGLQCPKHLWRIYNEPDSIPKPEKSMEFLFDWGLKVGELAQSLYDGIKCGDSNKEVNAATTKVNLEKNKPLFEAGFLVDNLYSRADILEPVNDSWDIIEVKSGSRPKDPNFDDVAFQKYVYEKAGLTIRRCFVMHIDTSYVKEGHIDAQKLLRKTEITDEVKKIDVEKNIEKHFGIINQKDAPTCAVGEHSLKPHTCPFKSECWSHLPEYNVTQLHSGKKKGFELIEKNILAIQDIPEDVKLSSKQKIQVLATKENSSHIDRKKITAFLSGLEDPITVLDFETLGTAIPIYDGTRPYQAIPFQYSIHTQEGQRSFLANGREDPREALLKQLKEDLPEQGTILAYNQSFEKRILEELGEAFPEYSEWVESILSRFNDLLIPFRNFDYYSPKQNGSASIKSVLPALTGKDYNDLEVGGGRDASVVFYDITFNNAHSDEEVKEIRKQLEEYCSLDTEGCLLILEELKKIVQN